ncbi:1469_t:CDS:2, partial [Cetraspora pellucida]
SKLRALLHYFKVSLESYKALLKADFDYTNENQDNFLTVNEKLKDFLVINEENKEQEHFTGEASNDFMNEEAMDSEFKIECHDDMLSQNEIESSSLFSGKKFGTWDKFLRQRTYLYDHGGFYESNTEKDTVTKKMQCPYLVNALCSKINNIKHSIFINKIVDTHNHLLNKSRVMFKDEKQFTAKMLADVKFMTENCKFEATVQRKFLESKYLTRTICSKDLYSVIQKFCPTNKSLLNDAAKDDDSNDSHEEFNSDDMQTSFNQLIEFAGLNNIQKTWTILANKFSIEVPKASNFLVSYLYLKQEKSDFWAENLTTFEQKMMYGNIHDTYKKALHKALQNKTKSQHLIELLEDFVKDDYDKQYESDDLQEIDSLNDEKENSDSTILYIQNPKIHHSRGRPK